MGCVFCLCIIELLCFCGGNQQEVAEEEVDHDNNKEDTPRPPGPLLGDTDEKHEQGPGEQAQSTSNNTSKYMTKF